MFSVRCNKISVKTCKKTIAPIDADLCGRKTTKTPCQHRYIVCRPTVQYAFCVEFSGI